MFNTFLDIFLLLTFSLIFLRIDELSRLNYSLDVELQKERESREMMQAKLRLHGTPRRTSSQSSPATRSSQERDS